MFGTEIMLSKRQNCVTYLKTLNILDQAII